MQWETQNRGESRVLVLGKGPALLDQKYMIYMSIAAAQGSADDYITS